MLRFKKKVFWYSIGVFLSLLAASMVRAGNFTNFTMVRSFLTSDPSANPAAPVTEASDGMLYGTTTGGFGSDIGGVFKIDKNGNNFSVIHQFTTADGDSPNAPVIEATNGVLYGTTLYDGAGGGGSIFEINKDGSGYAVIHSFTYDLDDGGFSTAPLLQASDGELYGTSQDGGIDGEGVVFRIDLSGDNFVVLHPFASSDGVSPAAGLIEGTNGMLYGTTIEGGATNGGTVFRMNKDGSGFSVIFNFTNTATAPDGYWPFSSLLKGSNGLLYGTTQYGGSFGEGIVFSMDYNGNNFTVLHNFGGANDGTQPDQPLVQGPDGGLYGSTSSGGGAGGLGTVFTINTDGSGYNVLLVLTNAIGSPVVGLISASGGALYGTCGGGGAENRGTIFNLTASSVMDNNFLNAPTHVVGTGWLVSGHGTANRIYTVLASTNVALPASNWTSLGTATADGSGNWQLNDTANLPIRFYRTSYP